MSGLKRLLISHLVAGIIGVSVWFIIPMVLEVEPNVRNIAAVGIAVVVDIIVSKVLKRKDTEQED